MNPIEEMPVSELKDFLQNINQPPTREKPEVVKAIQEALTRAAYTIVELNDEKPWGAYFRIDGQEADPFVGEFFPGLTSEKARLGSEDAELSPKILLVDPGQQLSWQYHSRRAERWAYLTPGRYYKSLTDEQGEPVMAEAGDVVQFQKGERHRLAAVNDTDYTLVAEIWQHSDPKHLSDEEDIVRLADDYQR